MPVSMLAAALTVAAALAASTVSIKELDVPLLNAEGKRVGSALLSAEGKGTRLKVQIQGLAPGKHGIHFHEAGRCEGPGFKTAGDHFNPRGTGHGLEPGGNGPHAGDLPNLVVDQDGKGTMDVYTPLVTLKSGSRSLLKPGGTALVVHEKVDDQRTDPSGGSGDRIACGVIGAGAKRATAAEAKSKSKR